MKISYDYSELINELKEEVEFGELNYSDFIWIIREDEPIHEDYRPINDWYFLDDLKDNSFEEVDKLKAIKMQVGAVLVEMVEATDIFKGI